MTREILNNTLVAMVSIGGNRIHAKTATLRGMRYAQKHGYDFVLVQSDIAPPGRQPYYAKLQILSLYDQYDRYCIIDDDLLLSRHAPSLPLLPADFVLGMVPDPSQVGLPKGNVLWAGNTGFVVCKKEAAPLFKAAIAMGDQPGLPGHADQPALNQAVWNSSPPMVLDWRWNFIPVGEYFLNNGGWKKWIASRSWRIRFYAGLLLGFPRGIVNRVRSTYGLHLTGCIQPFSILRHFR